MRDGPDGTSATACYALWNRQGIAAGDARFTFRVQGEEPRIVTGEEPWSLPLEVAQGGTLRLTVAPAE